MPFGRRKKDGPDSRRQTARNDHHRGGTRLNAQRMSQHPTYDAAKMMSDKDWVAKERARSGQDIRKRVAYIVGFSVLLLVVIVLAYVTALTVSDSEQRQSVSAADTYAITNDERNTMESTCTKFATALLASTYVNDVDTARQARTAALNYMATNTSSHDGVESLPIGQGGVAPDSLKVVVTNIKMASGGKAYSDTYVYTLHAQAVDTSQGSYVDPGYDITIYFKRATDENGTSRWMISQTEISESD